ncbi:MAG: hypothetical protein Q4F03_05015 [Eubacteriales bacterium]|nr:hypothetical protein [Eubacteriales bacterium]
MLLFDRKLCDEINGIKEKLKGKIDVEKLLREAEAEFVWDEEAFNENRVQDVYGKVLKSAQQFVELIENNGKKLPSDIIMDSLLYMAFMKVMEDLDSEIINPKTSKKRKKQLMTFAKANTWLECSCKCYKKYLKKRWLNAHEVYEKNLLLVFKYSVLLEDILTGDMRLPKEIKQQIDAADKHFWNNDCKRELKGLSLEDKKKNENFFKEVVKNKKIWECFSKDTIYELYSRKVEELLRKNMNRDEVWWYIGFNLKYGTDTYFKNAYLKNAYERCLKKVGEECIWDGRKAYNGTIPSGKYFYDSSIKGKIEEVCYDEEKTVQIIRAKIKQIFKENADIEDQLDFTKLVFAGILCEIRYETESHCGRVSGSDMEMGILYDDEKFWVYDKQSKRLVTEITIEKYAKKLQMKEEEDSEQEATIKALKEKFEYGEIKNDLNPIFQLRQDFDPEIKAVINGKGKNRNFSNRLEKIFSCKEGMSLYESYIVEKQSGFYLAWMIYNRTVKLRFIKNPGIQEGIVKLTMELSEIKNADIRLVIAEHVLDMLDEILCMENMDIIQGINAICEGIKECAEHFNEKYNLLYEIMLLIFTDEKCLSNGKYRYQLLEWNIFKLSVTFMNMERKFKKVYYECKKSMDKEFSGFNNELYNTELNCIVKSDANSPFHKWFCCIYEKHIPKKKEETKGKSVKPDKSLETIG